MDITSEVFYISIFNPFKIPFTFQRLCQAFCIELERHALTNQFFRSGRRVCLSGGAQRMRKKYRPESDSRTSDTGTGTDHHAGTSTGTFCSLCRIYAAEGSSFRMADYL